MAILKIVKFGDPMMRKVSRPVDQITPRIITLIDDMIDTMRAAGGCGLAAVQVGVLRRIAVIEVEEGKVYELINPKIVAYAGEQMEQEGRERGIRCNMFWSDDPEEARRFFEMGIDCVLTNDYQRVYDGVKDIVL